MILEIRTNDGNKTVFGGGFTFCVNGDKLLSILVPNREVQLEHIHLKDYPTYNVGGTIVYCEEA
jgi:hypothetical protein